MAGLASGAVVIGQSQPASTPSRNQPSATQPSGRTPADDQAHWREMADNFQRMNDRVSDRNTQLVQELAQAQTQTGEARVNAIAAVLTGVLQEQEHTNKAIARLQRLAFRTHFDGANMNQEWESWKQQYPFLDDSKDTDDNSATGDTGKPNRGQTDPKKDPKKDPNNPDAAPAPRSPK